MTDNEDVLAQAREVFGTAQPVSKQTKKENLMSFRKGPVFIALRLVTPYDKAKQDYGEPFPRLTFLVNGKYVAFPMESGLLSDVADFMKQLASGQFPSSSNLQKASSSTMNPWTYPLSFAYTRSPVPNPESTVVCPRHAL